ncbi:hypothetical protein GYA19_05925 [Candidatus Beckwithbacteria bacterium]|nr:hypothetical protein [Candidatus Beckwithbacteria bacterium]
MNDAENLNTETNLFKISRNCLDRLEAIIALQEKTKQGIAQQGLKDIIALLAKNTHDTAYWGQKVLIPPCLESELTKELGVNKIYNGLKSVRTDGHDGRITKLELEYGTNKKGVVWVDTMLCEERGFIQLISTSLKIQNPDHVCKQEFLYGEMISNHRFRQE